MTTIKEYNPIEAGLAELRERLDGKVYDVTTVAGMKDAKKDRAEVKGYRTSLGAKRKEIKAPALERCRAIDGEAKRITTELLRLEDQSDGPIKAEEERKRQAKEAKERAERERVERLQAKVARYEAVLPHAVGAGAGRLVELIKAVESSPADESFQEFQAVAAAARAKVLERLRTAHKAAVAADVEALELAKERAKLEKQKAEQDAKDEAVRKEQAAEAERLEVERAEIAEAKRKAEAEQLAAEAAAARVEADKVAQEKLKADLAGCKMDSTMEALLAIHKIVFTYEANDAAWRKILLICEANIEVRDV